MHHPSLCPSKWPEVAMDVQFFVSANFYHRTQPKIKTIVWSKESSNELHTSLIISMFITRYCSVKCLQPPSRVYRPQHNGGKEPEDFHIKNRCKVWPLLWRERVPSPSRPDATPINSPLPAFRHAEANFFYFSFISSYLSIYSPGREKRKYCTPRRPRPPRRSRKAPAPTRTHRSK